MCGILGVISDKTVNDKDFSLALDKIKHRGPDNKGIWTSKDGIVAFGHQRLAIIDISRESNQPFIDETGDYIITFNGEIYNYIEIKNELIKLNVSFRTNSDTEVLLEAYKIWGKSFLSKLVGMFSFAIYDKLKEEVFIARDRAGEKPCYYFNGDTFMFSSELKALLSYDEIPKLIDPDSLDIFLAEGFVPKDRCIVKGVNKLPAGSYLVYNKKSKKIKISKYWSLPYYNNSLASKLSKEEITEELELLIKDSVKSQLVADVPVGVLLSGGLDSSLVTAFAAQVKPKINTFTIKFPSNSKFDESKHARLIAQHFDTDHIELEAEPSTLSLLPKLAKQFDEPIIDSSMIPTFMVSKLVSSKCTVALGGDGADELFGGYKHYSRLLTLEKYSKFLHKNIRKNVVNIAMNFYPKNKPGSNWLKVFGKDFKQDLPRLATYFDKSERENLLNNHLNYSFGAEVDWNNRVSNGYTLLDTATRTDFYNYMCEDILVKVDRSSMLNSIEMRAPMLDYRIIEYAFKNIPSELKATNSQRKIILKSIAARNLPEKFDSSRKQGFSIPLNDWFQEKEWIDYFRSVLLDKNQKIFNHRYIEKILNNHLENNLLGEKLFGLLIFELWRKEYKLELN